MWKALDENTLLAYEMNGQPLPHWNGYPVRVVVPGWTATYWMKHLTSIQAVSRPFAGFWMEKAYRIPKGKFPIIDRFISQETDANTPITEMVVNSLVTNLHEGSRCFSGEGGCRARHSLGRGLWHTGRRSPTDGGRSGGPPSWSPTGAVLLGHVDLSLPIRVPATYTVMAKATNRVG